MVNGIKCTDTFSLNTCKNRSFEAVLHDEHDPNEHEIDIAENEDNDDLLWTLTNLIMTFQLCSI